MVIVDFSIKDKISRPRVFQETFLIVDIKFEVIIGMFFLKISNMDMSITKKNTYIENIYNYQAPTYYLANPNCLSKEICYSSIRCR